MDEAPELISQNKVVVNIWRHAQRSGNQVAGEKKAFIYCRPETVDALIRLHGLPSEKGPRILALVALLDDVSNTMRPRARRK